MMTEPKKLGRPSLYSEELADQICALIADGVSERQICQRDGMPGRSTVQRWKSEHPDFRDRSAQAREAGAEVFDDRRRELCEQLINLVTTSATTGMDLPRGVVDGMRVAMQELARSASMRDDRRFSDRKSVRSEISGPGGAPVQLQQKPVELTEQQKRLIDRILDEEF